MHELPIIERILATVLKHAEGNKVNKIVAVHLQVGRLSDLEDEWMQRYFDYLTKDTLAEGAKLKIERTPVQMKCNNCSKVYEIDMDKMDVTVCPDCGEKKGTLVSGREYFIKSMEVM